MSRSNYNFWKDDYLVVLLIVLIVGMKSIEYNRDNVERFIDNIGKSSKPDKTEKDFDPEEVDPYYKVMCTHCNWGRYNKEGVCPHCHTLSPSREGEHFEKYSKVCETCNGTGRRAGKFCSVCEGKGKYSYP